MGQTVKISLEHGDVLLETPHAGLAFFRQRDDAAVTVLPRDWAVDNQVPLTETRVLSTGGGTIFFNPFATARRGAYKRACRQGVPEAAGWHVDRINHGAGSELAALVALSLLLGERTGYVRRVDVVDCLCPEIYH